MTLNRSQKELIVAEIKELAEKSSSLVVATYTGMNNAELTLLRSAARKAQVKIKIVQNTLARVGFKNTSFESANDRLHGHLLYAFSLGEMVGAPRLINQALASYSNLKPALIVIEGRVFEKDELGRVANLPNRQEAIAILAGLLKMPVTKLARTLFQIPQKLASTIHAISLNKK
ncbi:MAG: 50S ribosomal protein L10 [Methylacidiphilales bacterium]|nr:50S ribosomal protein L10 [Candidatus Methylacidiphilales bacterium]